MATTAAKIPKINIDIDCTSDCIYYSFCTQNECDYDCDSCKYKCCACFGNCKKCNFNCKNRLYDFQNSKPRRSQAS